MLALAQARLPRRTTPALLARAMAEIADHVHRTRGRRNRPCDTVDWLRNRRTEDVDVDLLLAINSITHHLCFRLRDYILTRVSDCGCAKGQHDKCRRASPGPTGQARKPERCFHALNMSQFRARFNLNRILWVLFQCQRKCANRSWLSRSLASSLRGPLAATSLS